MRTLTITIFAKSHAHTVYLMTIQDLSNHKLGSLGK